ncbi:MAG: anthranilate synthase component I family protein [Helicobacter sp.]|nr:anthranilate synthase component I family protein [Helicobacter sp.]MDY5739885.1 anthranilate synthase component I family protein [Helicobacter sp.]
MRNIAHKNLINIKEVSGACIVALFEHKFLLTQLLEAKHWVIIPALSLLHTRQKMHTIYPSLEQITELPALEQYKRVAITKEIYSDFITPIEVLRILKNVSKHIFLLESVEDKKTWGRWSFLGFEPSLEIVCKDWNICIKDLKNITTKQFRGEPKKAIEDILENYKSPKFDKHPPFSGGLVGYFAYEYIRYSESHLDFKKPDSKFHDVDLMLFDTLIAFDNLRQKIVLITNITLENLTDSYESGKEKLKTLENLLYNGTKASIKPIKLLTQMQSDFNEVQYHQMVSKAKQYIFEGDIFQVVLSNPKRAKAEGSLFDVYRILRTSNPSPYMFYLCSDSLEIAGASPETLVKLTDSKLYTYPLAGSRPSGKNEEEDISLAKELLSDQKELAEHNMLVDLGRNDIGKIAKLGSVKVEKYMDIQRYSHIMHLGSTISGIIDPNRNALDAIASILPAGTLSGAPKIRACEIINELEGSERGIYGGAIGYLDFSGNMDTCIGIRLVYKMGEDICVRSGAGIVIDSDESKEYQECDNKAQALITALQLAQLMH